MTEQLKELAPEIMTIEQFKEYKLLFDIHIQGGGMVCSSNMHLLHLRFNYQSVKDWKQGDKILCWPHVTYRPDGSNKDNMFAELNKYMNKFIVMQKQEKIVWALKPCKSAESNILLTNKGKILYIRFNLCISRGSPRNDFTLINYEINNHNFDIPSYAICALKMLIKNIRVQYTQHSSNSNPKIIDDDFNSIYKNINEYLEQLKQEQLEQARLEQERLDDEEFIEELKRELLEEERLKQEKISESEDENCLL
jgi:hypothetical protein